MAYNPFNIFRRNQKALFAVLTVFIMIMFTLQSGVVGGDGLESIMRWFGGGRGSKEIVCRIDGHAVTERELDSGGPRSLQFRRVMANRFMYHAASQTTSALLEYANQQRPRLSENGQQMADSAAGAIGMLGRLNDPRFRNNPQILEILFMQIQQAERLVGAALDAPNARSEDKDVARAYQTVFVLLKHLRGSGAGEHYFLNAPNKTRRDLIEFMLWEKKADQLGIRFSRDDVKRLIQTEFYNFFRDDVPVRRLLQQTPGFTMDACLDAIATEFKVRAAQSAVLGHSARYGSGPALVTPYETFEYYREQTSPAIYEVIAVPAAGFVDRVPGEPSEAEINELFKKYADEEPNPRRETPGFKEPRKIRVAWFGVTGEEPYYKKLAEEQIKVGEVMAKAFGGLTVPLPGATGAWAVALAAPLGLKEPAVAAAYNTYVLESEGQRNRNYERSTLFPRSSFSTLTTEDPVLPSNAVKPGVAAATLGAFVGQSAGLGNVGAAAALSMTAPLAYEVRERITVGLPLVLGAIPNPALFQTALAGAAEYAARLPKPLPVEALRPELLKATIARRAKALAYGDPLSGEKGDVERFVEELKKMSENDRPKDKAAVEKYINEFLAARGVTARGASTAPHSEWTIEDDPGLAPLVAAQKESLRMARGAHGGAEPFVPFGQSFFWTTKFDMNTGPRRVPTAGTFLAEPFPPRDRSAGSEDGRVHYVYWRTEDVAAQKVNMITARPAVVAAWKRMKARELARARANAIADAIRANPTSDPLALLSVIRDQQFRLQLEIKDKKAEQRATIFTINNVCPLVMGPGQFGQPGQLMPFVLPETENVPYPTIEMETALLDNRDKPAKTVLVLPDAPKDTYYVATLVRRELKTPFEFKNDVYSQFGRARQVLAMSQTEAVKKARQSAVELLKKEFRYEETEDQKKKLDENVKSGGRNEF
ncbi:MAG: hypothetical protein J0I06_04300 [Planctomycetes bacterium]|nr:hypothetical protein [Planctomycetota bacterium]